MLGMSIGQILIHNILSRHSAGLKNRIKHSAGNAASKQRFASQAVKLARQMLSVSMGTVKIGESNEHIENFRFCRKSP